MKGKALVCCGLVLGSGTTNAFQHVALLRHCHQRHSVAGSSSSSRGGLVVAGVGGPELSTAERLTVQQEDTNAPIDWLLSRKLPTRSRCVCCFLMVLWCGETTC
jgi:hypothetical protein